MFTIRSWNLNVNSEQHKLLPQNPFMTIDDNSNAEATCEHGLNTTKYRLNKDNDNHLHSLNTKPQARNLVTNVVNKLWISSHPPVDNYIPINQVRP